MSFNTNWDVNHYKKDNESDEQWSIRKTFMEVHKNKFPEDKLVCLAQTFCNIEFLGCVYPKKTMELVEGLGKYIADEYRHRKKSRLQRTFAKASDAAKDKIKANFHRSCGPSGVSGASNNNTAQQQSQSKVTSFSDHEGRVIQSSYCTATAVKFQKESSVDEDDAFSRPRFQNQNDLRVSDSLGSNPDSSSRLSSSLRVQKNDYFFNMKIVERLQTEKSVLGLPLNFFLILDPKYSNEICVLEQSCRMAGIKCEFTFSNLDGKTKCEVHLNGNLVGHATDCTKSLTKHAAARMTVNQLKKHHYSLMRKAQFVNSGAVLSTKLGGSGGGNGSGDNNSGEFMSLPKNNIGLQMMKKMGWTGSGLGQKQQGIVAPITTTQINSRSGFGTDGTIETQKSIRDKFYGIFKDYALSDATSDLVFSADLSSFERKLLHGLACKFNLKSKSFGKGEDRTLVISKSVKPIQILYDLLLSGQKENEKYLMIEPEVV